MISYWLAQFLSRDNKTSARNKKKLFRQPKKPWKKDSTRCLHLSTRVNGYLKLFYFKQATVIANRAGYAVFFLFFHVSLEMLHQYIDGTRTWPIRGSCHAELDTLICTYIDNTATCHAKNSSQTERQIPAIRCIHCVI
jgi:hypothetical protein